jgi:hypothetical protein
VPPAGAYEVVNDTHEIGERLISGMVANRGEW